MPVRSLFCRKADPLSFQISVYVQAPKQIRKKCSPHSKSGRVNHPSAFLHKKPSVSFLMEADTILFCLHDLPCIFTTRKIMTPQERPVSALSQNKEVAAFRTTIVINKVNAVSTFSIYNSIFLALFFKNKFSISANIKTSPLTRYFLVSR